MANHATAPLQVTSHVPAVPEHRELTGSCSHYRRYWPITETYNAMDHPRCPGRTLLPTLTVALTRQAELEALSSESDDGDAETSFHTAAACVTPGKCSTAVLPLLRDRENSGMSRRSMASMIHLYSPNTLVRATTSVMPAYLRTDRLVCSTRSTVHSIAVSSRLLATPSWWEDR